MKDFILEFNGTFSPETLTTKKICNKETLIEVSGGKIRIQFEKDFNYNKAFFDQIAAFCRNYALLTGQIFELKQGSLDVEAYRRLRTQSLLIKNVKDSPKVSIGTNEFFEIYRSRKNNYKYINNSIPWLIIMHQEDFFIQKMRILFTVLEMLVMYKNEISQITRRYTTFFNEISIAEENELKIIDSMTNLWKTDEVRTDKNKFIGVSRIIDSIVNSASKSINNRTMIGNLAFELRNRNFHGNMSPVMSMTSGSLKLLEELYEITILGIYEKLKNIMRDSD